MMRNDKSTLSLLYGGSAIFGGSIAAIWAFTANRFQVFECLWITIGGILAGIGFGLVCYALIALINK